MRVTLDLSLEPYFSILSRSFRRWRTVASRAPTAMSAPKITSAMLAELTAELVSAYVSNNSLPSKDLAAFVEIVFRALQKIAEADDEPKNLPAPAVSIRKSVMPDYIICLEDGKRLKMLKRYLRVRYRMSPEEYRRRWSLPKDYPMVAPNYAAERSELAKRSGLGRRPSGRRRRS